MRVSLSRLSDPETIVGERVREGDRVVVPFNLGCGRCGDCTTGHGNVCPDGLALGFERDAPGAFAEQVHVPNVDYNAVQLPDGARGMPPTQYGELLSLLESGTVDPAALVTREVSLSAVPDRLVAMTDYDTVGVEVVTEF